MSKKPMVVLTGPTAVGKTALSIDLAKKINGAIISADSMQVYKYMDIGSAKITKEEMQGIDHYLIDELMPEDEFNIVQFQKMAKEALDKIYSKGQIPIITGGTGFYIQGLLYDIDFDAQNQNDSIRKEMEAFAVEKGAHQLHELLKDIDPVSYDIIHENNVKRVIRAIEFYRISGYPISEHNQQEKQKESPYNFAYFVLNDDRENLYKRIDKRVDIMVKQGLVEEVRRLHQMGYSKDMVSMQGLGYKEILRSFEGEYSMEEAIDIIKRETRRFAKRQITWFRREKEVIWINKNEYNYSNDLIIDEMEKILLDKGIIE